MVIDPLTRIEGHLRIEIESDGGKITNAWSEATQFRGIETIVQGRDPRDVWAFVQRICGVCTTVHAVASITAVENAIGSMPPKQALAIRDLVLGSAGVQDHVIHFYHLHALDWVDVSKAASADPQGAVDFATSIGSNWRGNTLQRMTEVRDTVKNLVASGQLSIFSGGYIGHPAYNLPPEANLMAVAHYLDALEFQRSMIRINTVFGGKNPHPNFLVGGMACSINQDSYTSVNQVVLNDIQTWINESLDFVQNCYVPDGLAILGAYPDYFNIGASSPNYLAVGKLGATYAGDPSKATADGNPRKAIKPGVILNDDYSTVLPFDPSKISESVATAWYKYSGDGSPLHPSVGETTVNYTGPTLTNGAYPDNTWLGDGDQYTWCKAPRYDGKPMQVGPLARVLLAYAQGDTGFDGADGVHHIDGAKTIVDMAAAKYGITLKQLNSTAGRTLARAVECLIEAETLAWDTFPAFVNSIVAGDTKVFNSDKWEPSSWDSNCSGYGLVEVARGMLSHWVTIKDGKIDRYQAVVPSTWNSGGRDEQGQMGPYETSLAGNQQHPLVDPTQPLEPLRTIHSFDPCMSCAVHVFDNDGNVTELVTEL